MNKSYTTGLTVIATLFFLNGLVQTLNDLLIPHLKKVFTLSYTQATLVQSSFFIAYFLISIPAGKITQKLGHRNTFFLALSITAIGALSFYPASELKSYPVFLAAIFVLASGLTIQQVAINPYTTALGTPETASARLSIMQSLSGLGGVVAPIVGTWLILKDTTGMENPATVVQLPYLIIVGILVVTIVVLAFLKMPKIILEDTASIEQSNVAERGAWGFRHLRFGVYCMFIYLGAEVAIGSLLVNFIVNPSIAGFTEREAGFYLAFYPGGLLVGRFFGGAILKLFKTQQVIFFNAVAAMVCISLALIIQGPIAMWLMILTGLFNSIMFPSIYSLSLSGLGKHTDEGSGYVCMAISGAAVLPLLQGMLADRIGIVYSFLLPMVAYLFVLYYARFEAKSLVATPTATKFH